MQNGVKATKSLPKLFTDNRFRAKLAVLCSLLLLAFAVALSICKGAVSLSLADIFSAFVQSGSGDVNFKIIYNVRLPRTFGTVLAGAGLAVSGVIIQSVLANPLAGPNIIGVNAGAGFFAALCCAFLPQYDVTLLPLAAFLGALLTVLLVYFIAAKTNSSKIAIVLAGVALSSLLNAGIDAVITFIPDSLTGSTAFKIGGVAGATFAGLSLPSIYIAAGLAAALLLSRELDLLSLGDETAKSMGLNVVFYRFMLLMVSAVLAGAVVSFAGLLGFVGLIVPHICRFFAGNKSIALIPVSAIFGAAFVTLCDVLSRVIFAPFELPLGILLSFIGGPFFIWLLLNGKGISRHK